MTADAALDLDHLRQWLGRTERAGDLVTRGLVERLNATLDRPAEAPPALALHWCLAPPAAPMSALGPDGHPARGGFLPPVPLPRRMWAGGRLALADRLRIGDAVERTSRVAAIELKEGRSGTLCFVTVEHEISTGRGRAVTERQDLVYRAPAPGGTAAAAPAPDPAPAEWQRTLTPDAVLLFRYSALTFNGHRIHYDRRYCLEAEGYPGLVVHGPLQATLLLELAAEIRGRAPAAFEFRGVHPLIDGAACTLKAAEGEGGLELWITDAAGVRTMAARAVW